MDGSVAATHSPVTTNITGLIKVEHTVGHADEYLRQTYYPYRATDGYYTRVRNNNVWGSWVLQPTRAEVDALSSKLVLGGVSTSLAVASNNNAGDTCYFRFDRSDGIQYKVAFGTNNTIYFQKYENGEWTTIWTK